MKRVRLSMKEEDEEIGPVPKSGSRGALIVVEGLDRSGKSSQCEQLVRTLQDMQVPVRYVRFPDRTTPIGQMINAYLQGQSGMDDHAIHLLFSANRWEVADKIRSDVEGGVTVIVDRYSYSGAVYSAAKENPNLSLSWAWQPEVGLPRPDICLFLGITTQEAAKRGGFGAERYETDVMQMRVRHLFQSLLAMPHNDEICFIDAGRPMEVVAQDVVQPVLECIRNVDEIGPLRKFGQWSFIPTSQEEAL